MFNNRFLPRPRKMILEQNFKKYLNNSVDKYNKLSNEINTKNTIKKILNKPNENIDNGLIDSSKNFNFIYIFALISIGVLIGYKSKK